MSEIEEVNLDGFQICHIDPKDILREHRIMLGLTQQAVADRAGIPLQSYQAFESGKRKIMNASFNIACRVIRALEMDCMEFFSGEYSLGEEIFLADGRVHYKKTGRPIEEDVE